MKAKNKLLSLAIPTFNRGKYLDAQIAWAVKSIRNNWDKVELIVCDNASADDTQEVCEKWQKALGSNIKIFRNEENVGLVRNCFLGLNRADGKYVWLIGDDDPIDEDAVSIVLNTVEKHPDLQLVHINHRCVSGIDGSIIEPKFYTLEKDIYAPHQGAQQLSTLLQRYDTGGLMFITANVLNRTQALKFIENNPPEDKLLLVYPMFLNASLASSGPFYLIAKCLIDCVYHRSSWLSEFGYLQHIGIPKTLVKLKSQGVSKQALGFCIDFQYKNLPSVRDMFYKLRRNYASLGESELKAWAYKWLLKKYLKWKL